MGGSRLQAGDSPRREGGPGGGPCLREEGCEGSGRGSRGSACGLGCVGSGGKVLLEQLVWEGCCDGDRAGSGGAARGEAAGCRGWVWTRGGRSLRQEERSWASLGAKDGCRGGKGTSACGLGASAPLRGLHGALWQGGSRRGWNLQGQAQALSQWLCPWGQGAVGSRLAARFGLGRRAGDCGVKDPARSQGAEGLQDVWPSCSFPLRAPRWDGQCQLCARRERSFVARVTGGSGLRSPGCWCRGCELLWARPLLLFPSEFSGVCGFLVS